MKYAIALTMILQAACSAVTVNPAFKDVQRMPPIPSEEAAIYLVKNERPLAEWIAETRVKCKKYGCVK